MERERRASQGSRPVRPALQRPGFAQRLNHVEAEKTGQPGASHPGPCSGPARPPRADRAVPVLARIVQRIQAGEPRRLLHRLLGVVDPFRIRSHRRSRQWTTTSCWRRCSSLTITVPGSQGRSSWGVLVMPLGSLRANMREPASLQDGRGQLAHRLGGVSRPPGCKATPPTGGRTTMRFRAGKADFRRPAKCRQSASSVGLSRPGCSLSRVRSSSPATAFRAASASARSATQPTGARAWAGQRRLDPEGSGRAGAHRGRAPRFGRQAVRGVKARRLGDLKRGVGSAGREQSRLEGRDPICLSGTNQITALAT